MSIHSRATLRSAPAGTQPMAGTEPGACTFPRHPERWSDRARSRSVGANGARRHPSGTARWRLICEEAKLGAFAIRTGLGLV